MKIDYFKVNHAIFWAIPHVNLGEWIHNGEFLYQCFCFLQNKVPMKLNAFFLGVFMLFLGIGSLTCLLPSCLDCLQKGLEFCATKYECPNGTLIIQGDGTCGCLCSKPCSLLITSCPCFTRNGQCYALSKNIVVLLEQDNIFAIDNRELAFAFHLANAPCGLQQFSITDTWTQNAVLKFLLLSADLNSTLSLIKALNSSTQATLNGLTFNTKTRKITTPDSTDTLKRLSLSAQAYSDTRKLYLEKYAKFLGINLEKFRQKVQKSRILVSNIQVVEGSLRSKYNDKIGSSLCYPMNADTFGVRNNAEVLAFGVEPFKNQADAEKNCFLRPTSAMLNVPGLSTADFKGKGIQQALVFKHRDKITISANNPFSNIDPENVGTISSMNHVLIDYLHTLPDFNMDSQDLPMIFAQIWGGVDITSGKDTEIVVSALFRRVGQVDVYYGTQAAQNLTNWAQKMNVPFYWARDPKDQNVYLENESNAMGNLDEIWAKLNPKTVL